MRRSRASRLALARKALAWLRSDVTLKPLKRAYRSYREGARSPDPQTRSATEQRKLPVLLELIRQRIGYETSKEELSRVSLSGLLLRAVRRSTGVRERDLH